MLLVEARNGMGGTAGCLRLAAALWLLMLLFLCSDDNLSSPSWSDMTGDGGCTVVDWLTMSDTFLRSREKTFLLGVEVVVVVETDATVAAVADAEEEGSSA